MIRKQIFIEEGQNQGLKRLAVATGKSEAALIREGITQVLSKEPAPDEDWKVALRQLKGMWADRPDIDEVMNARRDARRKGKERLLRTMGTSRK